MKNQFVIIRDDLLTDPITLVSDGVLIGRLMACEILLNHPGVSRAQAGIKEIDDNYYLFPLRPNNPVTLNGKPVEDNQALAAGDIIDVGPFRLSIEDTEESLVVRVSLQFGAEPIVADASSPDETTAHLLVPPDDKKTRKPRASPIPGTKTLDIFWDKRIREAGKMVRPSSLFPRGQRRSGKSQYNWIGTSDLESRWRGSFFLWATVVVGILSAVAAYSYASAFTPAPLSGSHKAAAMKMNPAIAREPNAGSCTGCHKWSGKIEDRCVGCHHTDAFVATVTKPHDAAAVGCIDCHPEHRGGDFRPAQAALASCTSCHNDSNKRLFNGKRVGTPHGGTFGYPVVNGVWSLKAVDDDEWAEKEMPVVRLPGDDDEKWKSKQFHALHSARVRVVKGLQGDAQGRLSCSSCHRSFNPPDRETPQTTCGLCHNGLVEEATNKVLIPDFQPNCISCHVQHVKDKRRWSARMLFVG